MLSPASIRVALFLAAALLPAGMGGQAPPPRDGDIRVLYSDVGNQTQVWLTLEPRTAEGKPAPPAYVLTFTLRFEGKVPKAQPTEVEVRANAGMLWAPRVEFWFVPDGRDRIDLVPATLMVLSNDGGSDYLQTTMSIEALKRIAAAGRVVGDALGFDFVLTDSQRRAVREFTERALSGNPAQAR